MVNSERVEDKTRRDEARRRAAGSLEIGIEREAAPVSAVAGGTAHALAWLPPVLTVSSVVSSERTPDLA